MLFYYINYLILIIVSLWSFHNKTIDDNKFRRLFFLITHLILSLMLALRHPIMGVDLGYGTDYGYLGMFKIIRNMTWSKVFTTPVLNYEKGYVVFNKIIGTFFSDSQVLLAIIGFICITSISYLIYKNSRYPLLSFIIYLGLPVFLLNFSGLRQAIAISITILAFTLIQKKKLIQFIFIVILASLFHFTAIIFLVAYPVYHIKSNDKIEFLSIITLPIIFLLRYPLFSVLSKLFKPNAVPDNNSSFTLFIAFILIYIFTIIFGDKTNFNEIGYRNLFYIACFTQALGGVNSIVMRVGYYFMIYLVLLLPEIIADAAKSEKHEGNNDKIIMYGIIFICFASFGLFSLSRSSWAMTNPYRFFWN